MSSLIWPRCLSVVVVLCVALLGCDREEAEAPQPEAPPAAASPTEVCAALASAEVDEEGHQACEGRMGSARAALPARWPGFSTCVVRSRGDLSKQEACFDAHPTVMAQLASEGTRRGSAAARAELAGHEAACEGGDAAACARLAAIYMLGASGVAPDEAAAQRYLTSACEHGDAQSCFLRGIQPGAYPVETLEAFWGSVFCEAYGCRLASGEARAPQGSVHRFELEAVETVSGRLLTPAGEEGLVGAEVYWSPAASAGVEDLHYLIDALLVLTGEDASEATSEAVLEHLAGARDATSTISLGDFTLEIKSLPEGGVALSVRS